MNDLSIQIARGPAAERLLADESFVAEWAALCAQCPWATGFQSPGFARAWFGTYRGHCEPILVFSRSAGDGPADGATAATLRGLLALARFPGPRPGERGETLIIAGGRQAEYHAWVSTPALGDAFPWQAVEAVRGEFPSNRLTFHYLAPGASTAWATGEGRRRCVLRTHRRPLIRFGDGSENAASLAKKSNKRRLKDLDKMGGLEFKRVTDPAEFGPLFDQIVRLYDFRHGAVQGTDPFCTLERQKQFHTAMLEQPGLLHVTAMKVGGHLAAAHFGVVSGKELQLGTIVHDPALAKQSPGKFQILMLVKMLVAEGLERLDLTPGGDSYKDRFATDWDEVHTLTVLPTARQRAEAYATARVKDTVKGVLARRGWTTAGATHWVKALLSELKHPADLMSGLVRRTGAWIARRREVRVYWRPFGGLVDNAGNPPGLMLPPLAASQTRAATDEPGQRSRRKHPVIPAPIVCEAASGETATAGAPSGPPVRRDSLDDLLAYRPGGTGPSRQAFLSAALSRVEEGQHPYTLADGGALRCCAWLAERPDAEAVATLLPGLTLPPDSLILHGFQALTAGAASQLADLLHSMLQDAGRMTGMRHAFLVVPDSAAESESLVRLAESLGFVHDSSLITETRFGRRHSRAQVARPTAVSKPTPKETPKETAPAEPAEPKDPGASARPAKPDAPARKPQERRPPLAAVGAAPVGATPAATGRAEPAISRDNL